jgi:hypothetical protein
MQKSEKSLRRQNLLTDFQPKSRQLSPFPAILEAFSVAHIPVSTFS